jgi:hypothetical protein
LSWSTCSITGRSEPCRLGSGSRIMHPHQLIRRSRYGVLSVFSSKTKILFNSAEFSVRCANISYTVPFHPSDIRRDTITIVPDMHTENHNSPILGLPVRIRQSSPEFNRLIRLTSPTRVAGYLPRMPHRTLGIIALCNRQELSLNVSKTSNYFFIIWGQAADNNRIERLWCNT